MWSEQRIRRYLTDRLAILEDRVDEIETILREPEDRDLEEQAMDRDDDGVLEGLGRSNRKEIEEIKDAVKRLDAGTYGKCKSCNGPIGQRRLDILPQTTICIRCSRETA